MVEGMTDEKKPDDDGLTPQARRAYERLLKVRASKTVALKECPLLRKDIRGLDGKLEPLHLRYYQVQGVYHMMMLKRMILGDGTGLGKTVETIATLCYLWARSEADNHVMVIAPKSAVHQWADEIRRFTVGVEPVVAGTEKPDPMGTITCNAMVGEEGEEKTRCGHEWRSKKRGKELVCPKCKTKWVKPKRVKNEQGDIAMTPGPIQVKCEEPADARRREYERWAAPYKEGDPKRVLILTYGKLVRDWNHGGFQPPGKDGRPDSKAPVIEGMFDKVTAKVGKKGVIIFDEATAFKSKRTKTHEIALFLSIRAHRVYGLTATLLKNRLFEGYCIFGVIKPGLFTTQAAFHRDYCFVELKKVGKARIPLIKGYKNLDKFRGRIDPFFLGRPKHAVSDELPALVTREIRCELSQAENLKYQEALSGIFELGDGEIREYTDHQALVSLIYCQQVVDSLAMLRFQGGQSVDDDLDFGTSFDLKSHKLGMLGSKEEGLVDLLTGELEDEKVIVYTRFASLVPRLQAVLKKHKIKSTCITGKVSEKGRRKNQQLFQKLDSDTNVIFITDAGSEAINLQSAMGLVFYDMPWSWGDYVQILGRMIRIGSPHKGVLAFHLIATRPMPKKADQKTIDHHVLSLLRAKKGLIDKVLGEAAQGALTFDASGSTARTLIGKMQGNDDDDE